MANSLNARINKARYQGLINDEECKRIKEALEKQIAKEPCLEGDGYADGHMVYDTWICPNCDEHYEMEFEQHMYCPVCGQKIKWDK